MNQYIRWLNPFDVYRYYIIDSEKKINDIHPFQNRDERNRIRERVKHIKEEGISDF